MPATPAAWLASTVAEQDPADGNGAAPRIIQLTNGNILLCWTSTRVGGPGSPAGADILGRLFSPAGDPVGDEFRLNVSVTTLDERAPAITASPGGGFIVTYVSQPGDGATRSIVIDEFTASGTPLSSASAVVTDTTPNAPDTFAAPQIAQASTTSVLISYGVDTGSDDRIEGRIYNPVTNVYSAPITLLAVVNGLSQHAMAVLANGNYVIAGTLSVAGDIVINTRIIGPGGANVLSATTLPETSGNGETDSSPVVVALTGGGFVVAWKNTGGGEVEILARRFDSAGLAQGSLITLHDANPADQLAAPAVVPLADGGFLILFDSAAPTGLFGQRYDSAGATVGAEFLIDAAQNAEDITGTLLADGRIALTYQNASDTVVLQILTTADAPVDQTYAGVDWIIGTAGDDTVFITGALAKAVAGGAGDDTLNSGSPATDTLYGGDGNDTLRVANFTGADTFGGTGTDLLDLSVLQANGGANATVLLGAGLFSHNDAHGTLLTHSVAGIENVRGSFSADTITGNRQANSLNGVQGNDTLDGGQGNDTLTGGVGADVLQGGIGTGDAADYSGSALGVTVRLFNGTGLNGDAQGDTLSGIEKVIGSALADGLAGSDGNDTLDGGGGNDFLTGRAGADRLDGGAGSGDIADYSGSVSGVTVRLFNGTGENGDAQGDVLVGIEKVIGSGLADGLAGSDGNDTLDGGGGNDFLTGRAGADRLDGGAGSGDIADYSGSVSGVTVRLFNGTGLNGDAQGDVLAGIEHLTGSGAGDGLVGSDGVVNRLAGGAGNDFLDGRTGNDTLDGGAGNDTLAELAGAGADTFVFAAGYGQDRVSLFENGSDKVDLVGLTFAQLTETAVAGGVRLAITATPTTFIELLGVTTAQIDAGDFV